MLPNWKRRESLEIQIGMMLAKPTLQLMLLKRLEDSFMMNFLSREYETDHFVVVMDSKTITYYKETIQEGCSNVNTPYFIILIASYSSFNCINI